MSPEMEMNVSGGIHKAQMSISMEELVTIISAGIQVRVTRFGVTLRIRTNVGNIVMSGHVENATFDFAIDLGFVTYS